MRRSGVELTDVASFDTLSRAFWRAARGKRQRPEVAAFGENLDIELSKLSEEILEGTVELGRMRSFEIRDPKPRRIHAPCFRERVLHHALMEHVGPVLDRSLVADTFACRVGKGTLAAVHRAQHHLRRYPWTVKVDMRAYFASIDHGSQHFAKLYLGPLDRFLLEDLKVAGMVCCTDDTIAWCRSRERACEVLREIEAFVSTSLRLELEPAQIQRSTLGVSFLGFRILPGVLRLSRRRRRRYTAARRRIEAAYTAGRIDGLALQAGASAALATTAHAEARALAAGGAAAASSVWMFERGWVPWWSVWGMRATIGSIAVARGTTLRSTCARRTATRITRANVTATEGSASFERRGGPAGLPLIRLHTRQRGLGRVANSPWTPTCS